MGRTLNSVKMFVRIPSGARQSKGCFQIEGGWPACSDVPFPRAGLGQSQQEGRFCSRTWGLFLHSLLAWDKVLKSEVDFRGKHFGQSPCFDSRLLTEAKREFSIVLHSLEFCIEFGEQTAKNKASVYPFLSPFCLYLAKGLCWSLSGDPTRYQTHSFSL